MRKYIVYCISYIGIFLFLLFTFSFLLSNPIYAGHCSAEEEEAGQTNGTLYRYCDGDEVWKDQKDCGHKMVKDCKSKGNSWTCEDGECVNEGPSCPQWEFDHNECIECGYARSVDKDACTGDTKVSKPRVRDRGCDSKEWCQGDDPEESSCANSDYTEFAGCDTSKCGREYWRCPKSGDTKRVTSPSNGDCRKLQYNPACSSGDPVEPPPPGEPPGPEPPGQPVCGGRCKYVVDKAQDKCKIGRCLDGSSSCGFDENNSNCGPVSSCSQEAGDDEEQDCTVTYACVGAGCLGGAGDNAIPPLVPPNAPFAPPAISRIDIEPPLDCTTAEKGIMECKPPSKPGRYTVRARTVNTLLADQCIWKQDNGEWDGPKDCTTELEIPTAGIISVAPFRADVGQGESWIIRIGENISNAPSCPAQSNAKVSSGTKRYPEANSGHCGLNYPSGQPWCTNPKAPPLNQEYAIDLSNRSTSMRVVLPSVGGKNINWRVYGGSFNCGPGLGEGVDYVGEGTGKTYYLHLCHIQKGGFTDKIAGGPSGTVIANGLYPLPARDGGPHLHISIAEQRNDGSWVMKEPNAELSMCK